MDHPRASAFPIEPDLSSERKEHPMTELIDSATANAAASAWHEAITLLTRCVPGGYVRQGTAGTRLYFTGIPSPDINAVCVGPEPNLAEVAAFAAELSEHGLPWTIAVRGAVGAPLARLAAQYGRTVTSTMPLNAWHAGSPPAVSPHRAMVREVAGAARVREVTGEDAAMFAATLAAGFGMPGEIAEIMCPPALFEAPGVTGFVLDLRGEAVATALNVVVGDHVGMFHGAVPPHHRRKGYYRTLVTARLAHAVARGARHAFAQNTPMSWPLYESLGFRPEETWTYLGAAE
jgi:GNAT superfamily N-acetyltransferase